MNVQDDSDTHSTSTSLSAHDIHTRVISETVPTTSPAATQDDDTQQGTTETHDSFLADYVATSEAFELDQPQFDWVASMCSGIKKCAVLKRMKVVLKAHELALEFHQAQMKRLNGAYAVLDNLVRQEALDDQARLDATADDKREKKRQKFLQSRSGDKENTVPVTSRTHDSEHMNATTTKSPPPLRMITTNSLFDDSALG